MSYGRRPYYIYSDGKLVHFSGAGAYASIPEEALAQFVTRMLARGNEVQDWLSRGRALSPDDFSDDFEVIVKGGWR